MFSYMHAGVYMHSRRICILSASIYYMIQIAICVLLIVSAQVAYRHQSKSEMFSGVSIALF